MMFQITFEKNPVAKTSKELVCFFCRSARFAVLQLLFSGSAEVAAGLSNIIYIYFLLTLPSAT